MTRSAGTERPARRRGPGTRGGAPAGGWPEPRGCGGPERRGGCAPEPLGHLRERSRPGPEFRSVPFCISNPVPRRGCPRAFCAVRGVATGRTGGSSIRPARPGLGQCGAAPAGASPADPAENSCAGPADGWTARDPGRRAGVSWRLEDELSVVQANRVPSRQARRVRVLQTLAGGLRTRRGPPGVQDPALSRVAQARVRASGRVFGSRHGGHSRDAALRRAPLTPERRGDARRGAPVRLRVARPPGRGRAREQAPDRSSARARG